MRKLNLPFLVAIIASMAICAPVFAEVTGTTNSSFLKTKVLVAVDSKVMDEFSPSSVNIKLVCKAGAVVKPGTAKCPQSGYFQYTATKTGKSGEDTLFTASISRSSSSGSLPVSGWIAEVKETASTGGKESSYINQVPITDIASGRTTSITISTGKGSIGGYRLFSSLVCSEEAQALTCFTKKVFEFAQVAIIVLAVGAIVVAGIIYMTSAGNPKQIEMAKKLIMGALTGVAVMVLGRLFLTQVVGVEWPWL